MKRLQYNSPVVLTFALLSLAALILGRLTGGWTTKALFCVYRSSLADPLTYVRFFGHALGHSSFEHFFNNMLLFLVIGPPLEEKYGSKTVAVTILITVFISGLVQWIFFPGSALLGASGVVFMMITMSSAAGIKDGKIPLTLILVLIFYIGREIVNGLFVKDNVSQLTHIIGGAAGAVFGVIFAKPGRRFK